MTAVGSSAFDTIIVGAGPAGLSAALVLGRCRRRVLVCDAGRPRNAASRALHGFLTRDGTPPADLRAVAREQLQPYDVDLRDIEVEDVQRVGDAFEARLAGGEVVLARTVLIATGVVDRLPDVEGLRALYGRSVFHCPYCDGWEQRDRALAAFGAGRKGLGLALSLKTWSADVVLCTNGPARLRADDRQRLARHGIVIRDTRIARLDGDNGHLGQIVFADGGTLPRDAIFLASGQHQHSPLPARLGCEFTEKGAVRTNRLEGTRVRGVYVAGDASHDVQLAIIAAAEGAKAAFAINKTLEAAERM